jgi:hypothetical protein
MKLFVVWAVGIVLIIGMAGCRKKVPVAAARERRN